MSGLEGMVRSAFYEAVRPLAERHEALVAAGIRMREAQRAYFRVARRGSREEKQEALLASKAAESEFDRLLSGIPDGEGP